MIKERETNTERLITAIKEIIETEPTTKIEYVKVVDGQTLKQITTIQPKALVAIAIHIGKTRLIDNFIV